MGGFTCFYNIEKCPYPIERPRNDDVAFNEQAIQQPV